MTSPTAPWPAPSDVPAPNPLREAIDRALPRGKADDTAHHDYDGRGLLIQPFDHVLGEDDCQRFTIR
ncbi:hypothetical protein [Dyella lutea]|uniref:Uncharacterized protein n=1 Tax=Dyella lutea TaxID=2950441 RepID=A0ABT1FAA4_9GAMM|nr:hypothetical protein [Dyella lutea]MCP1374307.1 hypothetical protein [Dyella lutea]